MAITRRARRGAPLVQRVMNGVTPIGECWIWQGRITKCGYGQMSMPNGRKEYAHRVAFSAFTGREIPPGMAIDHLCEVKSCVNPEHLELVTYSTNTKRWWASRRRGSDPIDPVEV